MREVLIYVFLAVVVVAAAFLFLDYFDIEFFK